MHVYTRHYLHDWYQQIRRTLAQIGGPDSSETVRPMRFDWELYGRILQAKSLL